MEFEYAVANVVIDFTNPTWRDDLTTYLNLWGEQGWLLVQLVFGASPVYAVFARGDFTVRTTAPVVMQVTEGQLAAAVDKLSPAGASLPTPL